MSALSTSVLSYFVSKSRMRTYTTVINYYSAFTARLPFNISSEERPITSHAQHQNRMKHRIDLE